MDDMDCHRALLFFFIHFQTIDDYVSDSNFISIVIVSFHRFLSTLNYSVPLATNATAVSKDECREFMSVFPGKLSFAKCVDLKGCRTKSIVSFPFPFSDLVRDLTEKAKKYDSKDASKWLARVSSFFSLYVQKTLANANNFRLL